MIALKVYLNKNELVLAGSEDLSVLNAIVNAVGKLGKESHGSKSNSAGADLFLNVGGLKSSEGRSKSCHVDWVSQHKLNIGDEITIKLLETNEADSPKLSREVDMEAVIARNNERMKNYRESL